MLLFSCYYSSISLFGHSHIVGGVSVVHSHLGGNADHQHSDSQYTVIDLLSNFTSEAATEHPCMQPLAFHSSDFIIISDRAHYVEVSPVQKLRGPPML